MPEHSLTYRRTRRANGGSGPSGWLVWSPWTPPGRCSLRWPSASSLGAGIHGRAAHRRAPRLERGEGRRPRDPRRRRPGARGAGVRGHRARPVEQRAARLARRARHGPRAERRRSCTPNCSSSSASVRRGGRAGRRRGSRSPAGPFGDATMQPARAGRPARHALRAAARRGPHRGAPARRGAPRLRREHQPRAEDPDRRGQPARRGARPGGRRTRRRCAASPSRLTVEAARLARITQRDHRALAAAGARRPAADASSSTSTAVIAAAVDQNRVVAEPRKRHRASPCGRRRRPQVYGDEALLVVAVHNLDRQRDRLLARRAHASASASTRRDGIVEIAVTDQGIGIPEDELERVFERFYRVDQARSRNTGGSGLGLSIVKHAVQNHGGDVRVWSQPGSGSTFTIRLPELEAAIEPGCRRRSATPTPVERGDRT